MANNVNTNLAQRLFAYIQHSVDITENITSVYRNSMIFIGDERQIYVPYFNAYVGIGMSSYNATISRINNIEASIANFNKQLYESTVTGIIPLSSSNPLLSPTILGGNITISGVDNYDPSTGFTYESNANNYVWDYSSNSWVSIINNTRQQMKYTPANYDGVNATSGISITYEYSVETVEQDGITVHKPINNKLIIDDSKTWTYMTRAYDYSLNYTRNYTDSKIETLYHDILGIGEPIFVPVSYDSLFIQNAHTGNNYEWTGKIAYYWSGTSDPELNNISNANWIKTTTAPTDDQTTYYILSTNYNNTYNTNISDGLQTLKEVAYILDKISDGAIGTVTYINKSQWNSNTSASGDNSAFVGSNSTLTYANGTKTYTGTVYRVMEKVSNNYFPTTNENIYAYYVVESDPDNLGIQIAYSIAGNSADIQDLHSHAVKAERGQTTLRSFSYLNNLEEGLLTWHILTNNNRSISYNTDTGIMSELQSLDSNRPGFGTYSLGDTRAMLKLNVASTYISYNTSLPLYIDNNINPDLLSNVSQVGSSISPDSVRYSIFEKVNPVDLVGLSSLEGYYKREGTAMSPLSSTDAAPSNINSALSSNVWSNIYKISNNNGHTDIVGEHINDTFQVVKDNSTIVTSASDYGTESNPYVYYIDSNDHYVKVQANEQINLDGTYYTISSSSEYLLHAVVDDQNHLATTAWVNALYNDKEHNIEDKINASLEQNYTYIFSKIDQLDNNSKYSYNEFRSYWAQNNPYMVNNELVSSDAYSTNSYKSAFATAFELWVNWLNVNASVTNTPSQYINNSYTINRIRSQYISNIVEENGVVNVETKELPTDQLVINTNIWGTQQDGATFTKMSITNEANNQYSNYYSNYIKNLYTQMYNGGDIRQIYINYKSDGTNYDTTYVQELYNGTKSDQCNYTYILEPSGRFISLSSLPLQAQDNTYNAIYGSGGPYLESPYYYKPYIKQTTYYEVNVGSIKTVDSLGNEITNLNTNVDHIKFEINNSTRSSLIVDMSSTDGNNEFTIKTNNTKTAFYTKNSVEAKSEYLTGDISHYSYSVFGGEGQNRINLNLHVTHIEDATITNTGLADAYDIKDYIDNIFRWVDISASISTEQLRTRRAFYDIYSTVGETVEDSYTLVKNSLHEYGDLYRYDEGTHEFVSVFNTKDTTDLSYTFTPYVRVSYFGRNNLGNIVLFNENNIIEGSEFYALSYTSTGNNSSYQYCNAYITTAQSFNNPLNMTLTNL